MKIWQPAEKLIQESLIKIPRKLKQLTFVQPSMDLLMSQLRQELPKMGDDTIEWWIYVLIGVAICAGIILITIVVYCFYVKGFLKMKRNSLATPKIGTPYNPRGRFDTSLARRIVMPSHSSAARMLGNNGNLMRTSNGIPSENFDVNVDDACSTEMHGNGLYVMLPTDVDDRACTPLCASAPVNFSKNGGARQKEPVLPHPRDSQPRQKVSVNCLVRE